MITLEVNTAQGFSNFSNLVKASITKSIATFSGQFSVTVTATKDEILPIKAGQLCRALVNGEPIITGYIDSASVSYSATSHHITLSGRDKTADLVDCTLQAEQSDFTGPISLKKLCEIAIEKSGVQGVSVIDQANVDNFDAVSLESAKVGESIYSFIERYARKRQVLLSSDGNGNLLIAKPGLIAAKTSLVNGINIKSANITVDLSGRYRTYIVKSAGNLAAWPIDSAINIEQQSNNEGVSEDNDIRAGRRLTIITENAGNQGDAQLRADWENDVRQSDSIKASVVIQDAGDNGEVLLPNRVVQYQEPFLGQNYTMLIKSARYGFNLQQGSTTTLQLVQQGAYRLVLQAAQFEKQQDSQDFSFLFDTAGAQHETQPDGDVN